MIPASEEYSYIYDTEEEEDGDVELVNVPKNYSGQIENQKLHIRFHPPETYHGAWTSVDSETTEVIYRWIPEPKNVRRTIVYVCDKALGIASVCLIIFGIVLLICAIALFQNQ